MVPPPFIASKRNTIGRSIMYGADLITGTIDVKTGPRKRRFQGPSNKTGGISDNDKLPRNET